MELDRIKWDERYAKEEHLFSLAPSRLLSSRLGQIVSLLPGQRALDIACGEGRNAIFLAQNGFQVDAVDISGVGLERGRTRAAELGLEVNFIQADLETYRLQDVYHLILNFNFLLRPLIPAMVAALAPGGVILMETILDAPGLEGMHHKNYLLQRGELSRIFGEFEGRVLLLEEDLGEENPVARVLFQKAD